MNTTRTADCNQEPDKVYQPGETVTDGWGIQYLIGDNGNFIRKTSKRMSKKKLRQKLAAERRRRNR